MTCETCHAAPAVESDPFPGHYPRVGPVCAPCRQAEAKSIEEAES